MVQPCGSARSRRGKPPGPTPSKPSYKYFLSILKSSRLSEGMRMPRATITSDDLRRFAVARSLFPPTTLRRAIARMRFVQAGTVSGLDLRPLSFRCLCCFRPYSSRGPGQLKAASLTLIVDTLYLYRKNNRSRSLLLGWCRCRQRHRELHNGKICPSSGKSPRS